VGGFKGVGAPIAQKFCVNDQVCKLGDVNGDGKADLIAFTPKASGDVKGDVFVMLTGSNGQPDGVVRKWQDWFCVDNEQCEIADINGDKKADLVAFDHNGRVWIALSNGNGFQGSGISGSTNFCYGAQECRVGDVDGDGKADVVAFSKGFTEPYRGDVWLAKSNGSSFVGVGKVHDYFCVDAEQCELTDVNGDGKADLVAFSRSKSADVWVAPSVGSSFAAGTKWHDYFCAGNETCLLADINGDKKKDVLAFVK
jgi:hypothetical protein